jgi:hypothetical protein
VFLSITNWSFRIVDSELFTFVVGPNKKQFPVHSYAITRLSEMLENLVTNGMAESKQKLATLNDVEEEDFARFFQFAYTGDYSTPLHASSQTASPPLSNPESEDEVTHHVIRA